MYAWHFRQPQNSWLRLCDTPSFHSWHEIGQINDQSCDNSLDETNRRFGSIGPREMGIGIRDICIAITKSQGWTGEKPEGVPTASGASSAAPDRWKMRRSLALAYTHKPPPNAYAYLPALALLWLWFLLIWCHSWSVVSSMLCFISPYLCEGSDAFIW